MTSVYTVILATKMSECN